MSILNPSQQGLTSTITDSLHRGLGSLLDRLLVDVLIVGLAWIAPFQPKDLSTLIAFAIFFSMLLIAISDIVHYIRNKPISIGKNGNGNGENGERKPFKERLELARKRAVGARLSPQ